MQYIIALALACAAATAPAGRVEEEASESPGADRLIGAAEKGRDEFGPFSEITRSDAQGRA